MLILSKYFDNQPAESIRIKIRILIKFFHFKNLDRTCNLIEEVLSKEKSTGKKLFFKPMA